MDPLLHIEDMVAAGAGNEVDGRTRGGQFELMKTGKDFFFTVGTECVQAHFWLLLFLAYRAD